MIGESVMSDRLFLNINNKFKCASKEEIYAFTMVSFTNCLTEFIDAFEEKMAMMLMITLAKIGVGHTYQKALNKNEIALVDEVFGEIFYDKDEVYDIISAPVEAGEYQLLRQVLEEDLCNFDMISFVLGFAYIDGHFDSNSADKLVRLFK